MRPNRLQHTQAKASYGVPGPRKGMLTVEAAIVIPVFFAFFFGLVEVGRGFMVSHLLTNAARAGCREGILGGVSNSQIEASIDNLLAKQGVTGHVTTVSVNGKVADASSAVSTDEISVLVSVPVSNITWLPGAHLLRGSVTGQFSLRRE